MSDAKRLAKMVLDMEADGVMNKMRASSVLEIMALANRILRDPLTPKAKPSTGPEYKSRERILAGEVFMIENLLFMSINVPSFCMNELQRSGYKSGKYVSAIVGAGAALGDVTRFVGRICGCAHGGATYQVVPYSLMETGVVKPLGQVRTGEMFVYEELVYIKCHYQNHGFPEEHSYVTTLDGNAFVRWSSIGKDNLDKEVTMLKPEFQIEGGC